MNKLSKIYVTAILLTLTIYLNAQQTPTPPSPKAVTTAPATAANVNANYEQVVVQGQGYSVAHKIKDTANMKSKEITASYDVSKNADILIENSNRNVEIKTWDQSKVKIVTTVYFEGEGNKMSDEEWLEKVNITTRNTAASFKIKSGSSGGGSYTINGQTYGWNWNDGNNTIIVNGTGVKGAKKGIMIYVPKENRLEIENKYADVTISSDINKVKLDIANGNADLANVGNLTLRSKYGNVSAGSIKVGELEFMNGRLSIKSSDDLDLDTKYSSVDIDVVKKLNFRSTNDEYELEEVATAEGSKNYGNLRITKLTGSLDLTGTNADLKIRNIEANVSSIKIDNKYADLRLPLKNIKNYTADVKGSYNSVHSDKSTTTENTSENSFSAVGGTGKGAVISVKCQNCTVDLK